MSAKLDKIGAEREKARQKRDEWDAKYKELDRKYKAQENIEIQDTVRSYNLTPDQLARFLESMKDDNGSLNIPESSFLGESEDEYHENQE